MVIRFANDKNLYDIPDERKKHNHGVSSLGGIAIFSGLTMSLLLVSDFNKDHLDFQYFIAAFFIIFTIGVIDDIFVLKAWKKFLGQFIVAAMLALKAGVLVTNLHGFLGLHELSYKASLSISFFAILLVINSFNLIDGIDGLAGSIGFVACLLLGVFFLINDVTSYAILAFAMCGALLGFLMYNFPPAKIFMGDSGSTLIGLITAILAIKFVENEPIQSAFSNQSTPVIAFGILLIPLMDVLRVFTLRIHKKQSPLVPDRNHLHHLLQDKGLSHAEVTCTLLLCQFLFAGLTFLLQNINLNIVLAIQFAAYFTLVYMVDKYMPVRKKMHIVPAKATNTNSKSTKVYHIYPVTEKVSAGEDS
ncbi:MraY family glycosyltransferase [Parafilimonas sp.]|uniref:MraY family glycosyltransferase n=1 Tax=Parafilimonas sp. TaxID=1969739 RepID=UPI0039E4A4D8